MSDKLKKDNLKDITIQDFAKAIQLAMNGEIKNVAPLGFSGDDVILFGKKPNKEEREKGSPSRISIVQFRNYSSNTELLITDKIGNFLFYGKLDDRIGEKAVLEYYWKTFELVKPFIETELDKRDVKSDFKNAKETIGWDMLKAFKKGSNE